MDLFWLAKCPEVWFQKLEVFVGDMTELDNVSGTYNIFDFNNNTSVERRTRVFMKLILFIASKELTDIQFKIFIMRYVFQLKQEKIAAYLDISQPYVSIVLDRCKTKIEENLEEYRIETLNNIKDNVYNEIVNYLEKILSISYDIEQSSYTGVDKKAVKRTFDKLTQYVRLPVEKSVDNIFISIKDKIEEKLVTYNPDTDREVVNEMLKEFLILIKELINTSEETTPYPNFSEYEFRNAYEIKAFCSEINSDFNRDLQTLEDLNNFLTLQCSEYKNIVNKIISNLEKLKLTNEEIEALKKHWRVFFNKHDDIKKDLIKVKIDKLIETMKNLRGEEVINSLIDDLILIQESKSGHNGYHIKNIVRQSLERLYPFECPQGGGN